MRIHASAGGTVGRSDLQLKEPLMPSLRTLRSVLVCFCFTCLSGLIWAQKDTGSIVGTVKDPSGAVVTGAKITVTDVDRGQTFTTTTTDAGEYVARPLHIGHYTVTVEKGGI